MNPKTDLQRLRFDSYGSHHTRWAKAGKPPARFLLTAQLEMRMVVVAQSCDSTMSHGENRENTVKKRRRYFSGPSRTRQRRPGDPPADAEDSGNANLLTGGRGQSGDQWKRPIRRLAYPDAGRLLG